MVMRFGMASSAMNGHEWYWHNRGRECRMDGEQSGVWRESAVVPRVPSRVNITMFNSIVTCIVDLHSYVPRVYHLRVANEKCMSL